MRWRQLRGRHLPVAHDVGFGSLLGQWGGAVEVAVDEADGGVLRGYFRAFVPVTHQGRDFIFGVGVGENMKRITAYVAGCASTGEEG